LHKLRELIADKREAGDASDLDVLLELRDRLEAEEKRTREAIEADRKRAEEATAETKRRQDEETERKLLMGDD